MEPLWAEILCSNENAVLRLCYQPPAQTCNSAQEMWNESREAANSVQAATVRHFNRCHVETGLVPYHDEKKRCIQMCKVAASQNTWCIQKGVSLDVLLSGALELLGNYWPSQDHIELYSWREQNKHMQHSHLILSTGSAVQADNWTKNPERINLKGL